MMKLQKTFLWIIQVFLIVLIFELTLAQSASFKDSRNLYFFAVNLQKGSSHLQIRDFDFHSTTLHWNFTRSYSSRYNQRGFFGWGWCSLLDHHLNVSRLSDREITLERCSEEPSLRFLHSGKNQWRTKNLLLTLQGNEFFLEEFNEKEKITTILSRFNKNGWISFWNGKIGRGLRITRDLAGCPQKIEFNSWRVKVQCDSTQRLVLKMSSAKQKKSFFYTEDLQLVKTQSTTPDITAPWEKYSYDSDRNLTSFHTREGFERTLHYDQELDRVLESKDEKKCLQTYNYQKTSDRETSTLVFRQCPNKTSSAYQLKFVYQLLSSGIKELIHFESQVFQGVSASLPFHLASRSNPWTFGIRHE